MMLPEFNGDGRKIMAVVCAVAILLFAAISFTSGRPASKELTVKLPVEGWEYVLNTLSEKPKKEVDPLYNAILGQLQAQLADTTAKPSPKK